MKLRHRSGEDRVNTASGTLAGESVPAPDAGAGLAQARDEQELRHAALLDSIATTIPAALLLARTRAWDEGWEAARHGLPKSSNPVRPTS